MQLVHHRVILLLAVDEVRERVAHLISSHPTSTGMHSKVSARMSWFEVRMRGRYEAIFCGAPLMRSCTVGGWVPIAPAIQAGIFYVGSSMGTSSGSTLCRPAPSRCSPSQGAVDRVASWPISDVRVKELRRYFPLLPIIVEVRGKAEGYLGGCQLLFDRLLFLFELPLG